MSKERKPPSGEEEMSDINISPLIDMVFILLIFFIVTTVFVEETGVEVEKPRAAMIKDLEKNSILIAVTANGQVVFGGQDVGIGGVRPIVKRMTTGNSDLPVIIQVDKAAEGSLLVRVIDEAKLGGAKKVSISAERAI
ncbi:MAG: biopolymer transporter ExbD [Verrucomicrobia bacterium]|nr:MAG: biopolymer transporter ExbD [Verrucomicrobiota bacterium]